MQNELKHGDIVRLKSGGPLMTVGKTAKMLSDLRCFWFDKTEMKSAEFPPEVLEKSEKLPGSRTIPLKF